MSRGPRKHFEPCPMKVADVHVRNRRLWVNLREKGGQALSLPCHHNLETYLEAYLDGAGLRNDPNGPLFRTLGRGTSRLTATLSYLSPMNFEKARANERKGLGEEERKGRIINPPRETSYPGKFKVH